MLFVMACLVVPVGVLAQKASSAYGGVAAEIARNINEHRAGMGLKPLKMNTIISAAAEKHTHNMASGKIPFGHDGSDARMAGISKQLKPVYGWAENVAMGPQTAWEVVDSWLGSKIHKENIEGDYNLIGIGIAKGANGDLYYTAIFINKGN